MDFLTSIVWIFGLIGVVAIFKYFLEFIVAWKYVSDLSKTERKAFLRLLKSRKFK